MNKDKDIYKNEQHVPLFARKEYHKQRKPGKVFPDEPGRHPVSRKTRHPHRKSSASKTKHKRSHTSRHSRSRRGRKDERVLSKSNRAVFAILVAILLMYPLFLIYSIIKNRASEGAVKMPSAPVPQATATDTNLTQGVSSEGIETNLSLVSEVQNWQKRHEKVKQLLNNSNGMSHRKKMEALEKLKEQYGSFLQLEEALAGFYIRFEQYDHAVESASAALRMAPNNEQVALLLGSALLKTGDYEAAAAIGDWMASHNRFSHKAREIGSEAHMRLGNMQDAIRHLHTLVDIDSRNVVAQNNLATAYSRLGEYAKAEKIFDGALILDRKNSVTYYNYAVCLAKQNKARETAALLERAIGEFGTGFVGGWVKSEAFDTVRNHPDWNTLLRRLERGG